MNKAQSEQWRLAVASLEQPKTDEWVTVAQLAELLELSNAEVRDKLSALEQNGAIESREFRSETGARILYFRLQISYTKPAKIKKARKKRAD